MFMTRTERAETVLPVASEAIRENDSQVAWLGRAADDNARGFPPMSTESALMQVYSPRVRKNMSGHIILPPQVRAHWILHSIRDLEMNAQPNDVDCDR